MAAASSLQTRPSQSARTAPSSQPSMHCGPPMEAMINGMVMNGPTPTMLLMLSAVAWRSPKPRTSPCSSVDRLRVFSKFSASILVPCGEDSTMKFSATTVVLAGGLGLVLGTMMNGRRPDVALAQAAQVAPVANDGKLRVIVFGAHPDDAEYRGAGVAMKWAKLGHHVKFVSATNGDIGHWQMAGGPLALRRKKEVLAVAQKLGVTTEVLDIHDGEIMPTLENRRTITRLIRGWNADVVITNRPNDYHPDHRYTSILVQDSAYMVAVPFFCPDVPFLKKNPVFLYASDRFERPNPFRADVAVSIDDVWEATADALLVMESQIQEGGANGYP